MKNNEIKDTQLRIISNIKTSMKEFYKSDIKITLDKNEEISMMYGLDFVEHAEKLSKDMLSSTFETITNKDGDGLAKLSGLVNDYICDSKHIDGIKEQIRLEKDIDKKKELSKKVKAKQEEIRDRIIGVYNIIFDSNIIVDISKLSAGEARIKINNLLSEVTSQFVMCVAETTYYILEGMENNLKKIMG